MLKSNPFFSKSKPKDFVIIQNAKVFEVLELSKTYPGQDKLKSVFTCESFSGTPRMCVYWGNKINLEAGDLVNLEGHYKNNVFLAASIQIKKRTNS